ncbi:cupin domain-containing protein [Devosia sp.]|uniref:cupin domain-containing protein n=1 Tax=Devosia sp. TaxID=1871048 RepID=UPI002FC870DA
MKRHLFAALVAFALSSQASAEDQTGLQYQNLLTPLLQGGVDVLGNPLRYPEGEVNITSAIVTIPPGGTTGLHRHEVPLFAHILEGELTVDYGEGRIKIYRAGDSVFEAMDVPHSGTNTGSIPMKLLAVYMGGGGKANTVPLN